MATITEVAPAAGTGLAETIAITNQTTNTVAVSKAIRVPAYARYATFVLKLGTFGGTSPLFDFTVRGTLGGAAPDDGSLYLLGAGWDGITQKTAGSHNVTIHIGPDITTDDTGSATAADAYGVGAVLPNWLVYTYTTDGTTDDEDYAATIHCYFRAG